jgi:hypothetical protein
MARKPFSMQRPAAAPLERANAPEPSNGARRGLEQCQYAVDTPSDIQVLKRPRHSPELLLSPLTETSIENLFMPAIPGWMRRTVCQHNHEHKKNPVPKPAALH